MSRKVTPDVLKRIKDLKSRYDPPLTNAVIAERLGLGLRTVRFYLNLKESECITPELSTSASPN
jgi:hypothetical protein